ncbi:MAG: DNA-binding protein [Selenomonadaceae bacterium]|nr:DNA-binding protein [Selenomonadaceae bacterium]
MEERIRILKLFDEYGALLNERQRKIVELYYVSDFSLSEIGEELNVTRQAAHDGLKRGTCALENFEAVLSLIKKRERREMIISNLKTRVEELPQSENKKIMLEEIKKLEEEAL